MRDFQAVVFNIRGYIFKNRLVHNYVFRNLDPRMQSQLFSAENTYLHFLVNYVKRTDTDIS